MVCSYQSIKVFYMVENLIELTAMLFIFLLFNNIRGIFNTECNEAIDNRQK